MFNSNKFEFQNMYIAIGGADRSRFYGRSLTGGGGMGGGFWVGWRGFTVDPEKLHAILISVVLPISMSQHYKKNYRVSDSEN